MFITAVPITKLFADGKGENGGHVLRETTSRGQRELVCPSRTNERGEGLLQSRARGAVLIRVPPLDLYWDETVGYEIVVFAHTKRADCLFYEELSLKRALRVRVGEGQRVLCLSRDKGEGQDACAAFGAQRSTAGEE